MKIIKMGKIPTIESTIRQFECGFCGTVFEAEHGEYIDVVTNVITGDTNAFGFGITKRKCQCPICKRDVYAID